MPLRGCICNDARLRDGRFSADRLDEELSLLTSEPTHLVAGHPAVYPFIQILCNDRKLSEFVIKHTPLVTLNFFR